MSLSLLESLLKRVSLVLFDDPLAHATMNFMLTHYLCEDFSLAEALNIK